MHSSQIYFPQALFGIRRNFFDQHVTLHPVLQIRICSKFVTNVPIIARYDRPFSPHEVPVLTYTLQGGVLSYLPRHVDIPFPLP